MSYDRPDLDSIINYQQEYLDVIQKPRITGTRLSGLCPFHNDSNASFSADTTTGKYHCFACGAEGNFLTFYANTHNCDTKDAYKELMERYHVTPTQKTYTVDDYAKKKHLPAEWLREEFGLSDGKEKDGQPFIKIPYYDVEGRQVLFRKRYPEGSSTRFKWQYGSAGKLVMYGEQKLDIYKQTSKQVLFVEGESDTQTLRYLGFPALGVPGASTFKAEWARKLDGIETVYLHIEPDKGGETFLSQMAEKLRDGGYTGKVMKWSCFSLGSKDPSDLFIAHGETARDEINAALIEAQEINLLRLEDELPANVTDAPIRLRCPEGWIYSDAGISMIDEKTAQPILVCRTPILITRRLQSTETGDEKIELAFRKDGAWHTTVQNRSLVFQSRSIVSLADLGMTLNSENAKFVVRFLDKLESENFDIIPKSESASSFGWITDTKFLPGFAPDVILDIDSSLRGRAGAYCLNGTLEGWKQMVGRHRERDKFRFILAASFAAPLLRIVRQRIFFVYNWGGSKGGKTAALKAALSVWGDPERLMVNFNATQVALERIAGFYCDLPLGIDERQLAGDNQSSIDKTVYMLASGTGRARGAKAGGLQAERTWRTIALATGEEPLASDTSQTGISTRVLEIYGGPFDNETDASLMHQQAGENCGWAGIEFIRNVLALGEATIREKYAEMLRYVSSKSEGRNSSHAAGIAVVALADTLVDQWFFGCSATESVDRTHRMIDTILRENAQNAVRDVNESAVESIRDWILMNIKAFDKEGDTYQRFGWFGDYDDTVYVFPTPLTDYLKRSGYSVGKTKKFLAEQGYIQTAFDTRKGCVRNTFVERFAGVLARVMRFNKAKLFGDDESETENPFAGPAYRVGHSPENDDDEVPF